MSHAASAPDAVLPYDQFAFSFNRMMAEDFCRRAWPVVERLFLRELPPVAEVLDLCCGAGQMARRLSERGFRVLGLDASEEMVRLARQNAPRAEFVVADAREFSLPGRFAGVLSTFNSLAHVPSVEQLTQVYRNVAGALVPSGVFCFDLSMEESYAAKWRGSFALVESSHACIISPSWDAAQRLGRNDITVFRLADELGAWLRSDFTIAQKCHSAEELRAALAAAGFTGVESYDAEDDLGMAGERGRSFFRATLAGGVGPA